MSRSTRLGKRGSEPAEHQPSLTLADTPTQRSPIPPAAQTAETTQQETASTEQAVIPPGHRFGQFPIYADGWSQAAAPAAPPAPPAGGSPGFTIQARLAVNAPGDAFEQEADRVAEQVMRSPAPDATGETPASPGLRVQRSSSKTAGVSSGLESSISQMQSSGGSPLPEGERSFFEQRMGHDFGQIRIHHDAHANQTADGLNAHAFTVGTDIAFAAGQYQPGTDSGRHLLAHELTHTIQQTGGIATKRIQRKAVEHEPAADEGVCPVCGKVGKGTCPGCGSPFLPVQRKARSDEPDDAFELKSDAKPEAKTDTTPEAKAETKPELPSGTLTPTAPEQREAATTGTSGASTEAAEGTQPEGKAEGETSPEQAGSEAAKATASAIAEVAPAPDKAADEGNKKAEDASPGNPVLQAVQQSAADGPRQALDQQAQRLREMLRGPEPKQEAGLAAQPASQQGAPGQADPALQDALGQVVAGRDQAKSQADAATGELAASQDAIGQLANAPVELAPLDIAALLKEAGMDNEGGADGAASDGPTVTISRKAAPGAEPLGEGSADPAALQALVEQLRSQAQGMVSSFMGNATGRVQSALALGQAAPARLQAPVAAAQAAIMAGVQTQSAQLTAQFAQAKSEAQSQAEAQRAQIEAQHSAALSAIQATSTQTTQQIETSYQQAVQRVQQLEQTQTQTLTQRYAQADTDYRAAGTKVGQEAIDTGNQMAQGYLAGKINRDDSFTDGDLTDRRCEARAKAAREVASQYQKGLVEEANKQAGEAQKGLPRDIQTLGQVRTEAMTQLETQHRTQLDQARAAAEAAQQQAEQAKTRFLEAVEQTLTSTMQTLSEQETSQLQGLTTMGEQQATGIEQAGQSTIAALTQSVTQAVSGLQGSLGGIPGALAGVQVPDPEALGGVLSGAMGQIEGGLSALQSQIEQGVATAEQQFMQQSQQVVTRLATTGQEVTSTVSELIASVTSGFAQLQSGVQSTYSQISEAFTTQSSQLQQAATDGFTQVVTGTEQSFGQINTNVDTAFDQAAPALENGLRGALGEMRTKIGQEAENAAAQEQPRWKGILKIVLIIAVIVVVALVVGPFVIGAVGAAAGALGASAAAATAIGAVVGGAIVGAGTSAVIQMGSNLIDGKPVLDGVVEAMIVGAIGGAMGGLGGLAGQGLANGLRMSQGFAQNALKLGVDMAFDTAGGLLGNLATGQPITLDGVLQGLISGAAVSMSMGGLSKLGRFGQGIEGIQQRSMAAGESFGANVGTAMRPNIGVDTPAPRGPQVDVGTPTRPDLDMGSNPAPRTNIDEPSTAPAPRTTVDEPDVTPAPRTNLDEPSTAPAPRTNVDEPDVTPAPRANVDEPSTAPAPRTNVDEPATAPRGTSPDEPSTTPRSTAGDESATAPAPRNNSDTPRLDSDPERPANQLNNNQLGEASTPVRIGTEEHTVTPRNVGGETQMYVCSACGPITGKIDAMLDNPNLSPELRAELTTLKNDITALEARINNGEVTSGQIVRETGRVAERLNAIGRDNPHLGTAVDTPPNTSDLAVRQEHAPKWGVDSVSGKFDPNGQIDGLSPTEVETRAKQPAQEGEPEIVRRRRRYLDKYKDNPGQVMDLDEWAESGFQANINRDASRPHEAAALAAVGATPNNTAGQRLQYTHTESVDVNGRVVPDGDPKAVDTRSETVLPDGTRPNSIPGRDVVEHKHMTGDTDVYHDSHQLRGERAMADHMTKGDHEMVLSSDRPFGSDGKPVVRPSSTVAAGSSAVYYYDPSSGRVTHQWTENGWEAIKINP